MGLTLTCRIGYNIINYNLLEVYAQEICSLFTLFVSFLLNFGFWRISTGQMN